MAQTKTFDVPAQSAATGIPQLATQADVQILVSADAVSGKSIRAIKGTMTVDQAVRRAAADAGLRVVSSDGRTYTLASATAADTGNAATLAADDYRGEEIIVTAQKRTESAQNVPIAITALSQKNLDEQKIEGGPDIMRAVPNLTFSKSNFTGYNLSIRGVGTKAISATSDPGVAIAFNNAGLIHNRFFEQEFFDMERLEVLRGPQGTLYGRNATGGVVNLISAKPKLGSFEGRIKGEVGNYDSRRMTAMLNVPIAKDVLGIRIAGSMTNRDGYDYNSGTDNRVNGRDLWSLRTTVAFEPAPWFRANAIWERFSENDNRSRTGKQLCTKDPGRTQFGARDLNTLPDANFRDRDTSDGIRSYFQQGCLPGSLYDEAAFGVVSGYGISFVQAPLSLGNLGLAIGGLNGPQYGFPDGALVSFLRPGDPFADVTQSQNLREIASIRDPKYRASADLLQLNIEVDFSPSLTFVSQTTYNEDKVYSFQDYLRNASNPAFVDTSTLLTGGATGATNPSGFRSLAPGGVFCDPQIGCSDRIGIFDVSQAKSKQFNQEVRLQSDFDGPLNFSIGANYTRFKTLNDYYVMSNVLTALSYSFPFYNATLMPLDRNICPQSNYKGGLSPVPMDDPTSSCIYVDPNPLDSINGEGHNYFRSKNPYKLRSYAMFGEAYWNVSDDVKLTAGLRYTDDRKSFTPIPSQALLFPSILGGGTVNKGYPEKPDIVQSWGEFTGRIGVDWQPQLNFTDDTLLYAFYSRGYKGGGANPPTPGYATEEETIAIAKAAGVSDFTFFLWDAIGYLPSLTLFANEYGSTFKPEFVNAFEIGAKNTLLNGALTLNATAFYYDYKDYQVSQIRDRTAVNENFDAKVWGAELEARFAPTRNLRFNANVGYLKTKIAKGETSIDIMNRTQGNSDYAVVKPWVQLPSNCVLPASVIEQINFSATRPQIMCPGVRGPLVLTSSPVTDPATGAPFDYANYPELNGGAGLSADLSGNELPNSPRWTVNLGAEYTFDFDQDWSATIRGDGYWQAKSWHRVYNLAPYDRLRSWKNFNISLRVDGPDDLSIEAYVKNVFNKSPITDDLPPSEWSKIDDILDYEGDYECRARSIARKRLLASCVKRRL
ncbi:hypothetical protein CDQ91_19620, partial [Sphingopyxis witflariensis]